MKKIFLLLLSGTSVTAFAQPKVITQAIITTKTTIVSPDGEEDTPPVRSQGPDGEQRMTMRFGGDGETKSTTYLKGDLVKTVVKSEMVNTSIIRDNAQKKTTTLMEMIGRQTGFYATDADMEEGRKQMDSMMQARGGANAATSTPATVEVVTAEGSKKVAGYECKKAFVISTRNKSLISSEGILSTVTTKDTSVVWYAPDFKFQGLANTGGSGGAFSFGRMGGLSGLDKLAGFPMQYETKMQRGRKMIVEVSKIELDKEIKDKEFEIPKEYELKSMKEMQQAGTGGYQMRIGG